MTTNQTKRDFFLLVKQIVHCSGKSNECKHEPTNLNIGLKVKQGAYCEDQEEILTYMVLAEELTWFATFAFTMVCPESGCEP